MNYNEKQKRKQALLILVMLNWMNVIIISVLLIMRFFCN